MSPNDPQQKPSNPTQSRLLWYILTFVVALIVVYLLAVPGKKQTTNAPTNTATTVNTNTTPSTNAATSDYETYKQYAGSWSGEWKNTTFGSSGAMRARVTIEPGGSGEMKLDVDGLVFGLVNPAEKTLKGTYDANSVVFTASGDDVFGNLTLTFNRDSSVTFSGAEIPATNVDTLRGEGKITLTGLNLTYRVGVGGADFANGTATLKKS